MVYTINISKWILLAILACCGCVQLLMGSKQPKAKPKLGLQELFNHINQKIEDNTMKITRDPVSGEEICLTIVPRLSPVENSKHKGSCLEKSRIGTKCFLICKPGYQEATLTSVCTKSANNSVDWSPPLKCIKDSCGVADSNGYYKFSINVNSVFSPISLDYETNVYYAVFDSNRRLPIYTATYVSKISYYENFDRIKGFINHPCEQLYGKQATNHAYKLTINQRNRLNGTNDDKRNSWDRGHLSPQNLFRWSYKSAKTSNFLINLAPQDYFTNQHPWELLEAQIKCFLKKREGVVITGISPATVDITRYGFEVPSFFWKLVCFHDIKYGMVVVGFIGDNSYIDFGDEAKKKERIASVLKFRSKAEVMSLLNTNRSSRSYSSVYATMWNEIQNTTLKGKVPINASFNFETCHFATDLVTIPDIKTAWRAECVNKNKSSSDSNCSFANNSYSSWYSIESLLCVTLFMTITVIIMFLCKKFQKKKTILKKAYTLLFASK